MTYRWNENDLGLEGVEGWAQYHDGAVTAFKLNVPKHAPRWLEEAMEDGFGRMLPTLIAARQYSEAAERDDAECYEQAEALR